MLEALKQAGKDYPFEEGRYGIPFSNIEGESVKSGSGQLINVVIDQSHLYITDECSHYFMESIYLRFDGKLLFDILTKRVNREGQVTRHPDMFAKHYMRVACNYYQNLGLPVKAIKGRWNADSDNRAQFMRAYKESNDPRLAAASTWTGRVAADLGFTTVYCDLPPLFGFTGGDVEAMFVRSG